MSGRRARKHPIGTQDAAKPARPASARTRHAAHIRLFTFLALLLPLFSALHALADAGVPRVEVQIVPRDVRINVPVDVFVERIVERLVFVPVPSVSLRPWTRAVWDVSRLPQAQADSTALARVFPVTSSRGRVAGVTVVASGGNANVTRANTTTAFGSAASGPTDANAMSARFGAPPSEPRGPLARAVAGLRTVPATSRNPLTRSPVDPATGAAPEMVSLVAPPPALLRSVSSEADARTGGTQPGGQAGSLPEQQPAAANAPRLSDPASSDPAAAASGVAVAAEPVSQSADPVLAGGGAAAGGLDPAGLTPAEPSVAQTVPVPASRSGVAIGGPAAPPVVAQRSPSRERRASNDDGAGGGAGDGDDGRSRSVSAPALSAQSSELVSAAPTPTVAPSSAATTAPVPATPVPPTAKPAPPAVREPAAPPTAKPAVPPTAKPAAPPTREPATRQPARPTAAPATATPKPAATKAPPPKPAAKPPTPKPAAKPPTPKPAAKPPTPKPAATKAPTPKAAPAKKSPPKPAPAKAPPPKARDK